MIVPKFGTEKQLTEAYKVMQSPAIHTQQGRKEFIDFYNKYYNVFFEGCELQPGEMQGQNQVYRWNSQNNQVGGDNMYCSVIGFKPVIHNEAVGHKRIPLVENKKLMFKNITLTYKLPYEQAKTIYYNL